MASGASSSAPGAGQGVSLLHRPPRPFMAPSLKASRPRPAGSAILSTQAPSSQTQQPPEARESPLIRGQPAPEGIFAMELDDPHAPQRSIGDGSAQKDGSGHVSRSRSSGHSRRGSFDDGLPSKKPRSSGSTSVSPALRTLSASASPALRPLSASASPMVRSLSTSPPSASALVPLEAGVEGQAALRHHELQTGRRVFHVHFGHGYVASLETAPTDDVPAQEERALSSKTHNIHVYFDSPKYKQLIRLRAFYAVPKMVVIPSSSALRKRKFQQAAAATPAVAAMRVNAVRDALASGQLRRACDLVVRWQLRHAFEPTQLLQQLLDAKEFAAAVRFSREFGLTHEYPSQALLRRMLEAKRFEGVLKHVDARSASVDGDVAPTDVVSQLVRSGKPDVALKYVHKFGAASKFPPAQLVGRCLQGSGELNVRTSAMLLKYVSLFRLEEAFPLNKLVERVEASGITVHALPRGRYILKGRKRAAANLSTVGAEAGGADLKVGSAPS